MKTAKGQRRVQPIDREMMIAYREAAEWLDACAAEEFDWTQREAYKIVAARLRNSIKKNKTNRVKSGRNGSK